MATVWHKILDRDELAEGRVKTVVAGHRSLAVSRFEGGYGALDNRCPHQGGPLGEGAIENGLLHVDLVREVPEALKPRRIEIGGPKTIDA